MFLRSKQLLCVFEEFYTALLQYEYNDNQYFDYYNAVECILSYGAIKRIFPVEIQNGKSARLQYFLFKQRKEAKKKARIEL